MLNLSKEEILNTYKERLSNLNHITTIPNLESILTFGLLNRKEAEQANLIKEDIASKYLLKSRGSFDRFVPLFIAEGHTTSFYHLQKRWHDVIHIWIKEEVVLLDGVLISNGNLIHRSKTFSIQEIDALDRVCSGENSFWDVIEQKHTSEAYGINYKSIRAAEVLVPGKIPREYFKGIIYHSSSQRGELRLKTMKEIMGTMGVHVPIYIYQYPMGGRIPRLKKVS